MDPNEIARLVAELQLSLTGMKVRIKVPEADGRTDQRRLKNVVVGKIFDNRVVNRDTLRNHLPRILQLRREADIEIVGDNLFAVGFSLEEDRFRAISNGPWHFFRSLMLFKEPIELEHPTEIMFDEFTTWIQCHNLPIACMVPAVIRSIGEQAGRVLEIDTTEGGTCLGQFRRVRVVRRIEEPLLRCVSIEVEGGQEERIVLLRYERLPNFCAVCGRVSHVLRHCQDTSADKQACVFGTWLRVGRVMEARRPRYTSSNRKDDHGRGGWNGEGRNSNFAAGQGIGGDAGRWNEEEGGGVWRGMEEADRKGREMVVSEQETGEGSVERRRWETIRLGRDDIENDENEDDGCVGKEGVGRKKTMLLELGGEVGSLGSRLNIEENLRDDRGREIQRAVKLTVEESGVVEDVRPKVLMENKENVDQSVDAEVLWSARGKSEKKWKR